LKNIEKNSQKQRKAVKSKKASDPVPVTASNHWREREARRERDTQDRDRDEVKVKSPGQAKGYVSLKSFPYSHHLYGQKQE
jgi:hypothetical protein